MESVVCGTVILYNPNSDVLDNIHSFLGQVEYLIVIDNSDNPDSVLMKEIKLLENIKYISFNENLGIARALNIAAEIAIEKGYQYLLTMDQDSKTPQNMVASLLEVALGNTNAAIISPLHANKYGTHIRFRDDIEKVDTVMTSGNLLSLEAYRKIGKFNEDYFIDYVDIEYCFRINISNYSILQLNRVILEHNEAAITEIKILWKKIHPHNHSPFRLYYKTRNILALRKTYKQSVPVLLKREYKSYNRTIVRMLLFEKNKLYKSKMLFHGVWDYLLSKIGKRF